MYKFRTTGGASFAARLDFSDHAYANISFFDTSRSEIPFHVSVRQRAGLAVTNAKYHGKWQAEKRHEIALDKSGDDLTVSFDEAGVAIIINGTQIVRFDEEYTNLEEIAHVNFRGGFEDGSLEFGGDINVVEVGEGELQLTAGLAARGWAVDPSQPRQSPSLRVLGLEEAIPFSQITLPEIAIRMGVPGKDIGVWASLPGRIWSAESADGVVKLQLENNGLPCGQPLRLTREVILKQIVALTETGDRHGDMFEFLIAIEHVRFATLWDSLPDHARQTLKDAAEFYGVAEFMLADVTDEGSLPDEIITAPVDPNAFLLGQVRSAFGQALADAGDKPAINVLTETLDDYPSLAEPLLRQIILAVTEPFCTRNSFDDLYEFAAAQDLTSYHPGHGPWHDSVILPFLFREGNFNDLCSTIWGLAESQGWVVTPALAWVVRATIRNRGQNGAEQRLEDVLYAFMGFIDKHALDYWDRTACEELTRAAALMTVDAALSSDFISRECVRFALRNFGLSRQFWRMVEQEQTPGAPLDALLAEGGDCFRDIEQYAKTGKGDIHAALAFFAGHKNPDVDRYRVELSLQPAALGSSQKKSRDAILRDAPDPNEAAVRALALPNTKVKVDDQLSLLARNAIRERYYTEPKAPYSELQTKTCWDISDFLGSVDGLSRKEANSPERLAALRSLLNGLSVMSGGRSLHLGVGMALSLLEGLAVRNHDHLATHVVAHLNAALSGLPEAERDGLFRAPAILGGLHSLHMLTRSHQSMSAQAGLALFPGYARMVSQEPQTLPPGATPRGPINPLFNTMVVVFSCLPNLDTRVEAMRQGWLAQLEALGIPYIVVVGGGDGRLEGDVVHLDAPDDYEGLPQKTLKAVEWVHDNTDANYLFKVDDDCFLNVDEYFHNQSYRKFDFYGRVIRRQLGEMDRAWHCAKSVSERGRLELDKSPEPSVYCDGGSGYSLSRHAMSVILRAQQTDIGSRLVATAFMEDKLVGDLLSLEQIAPSNEDYYVAVQRRTHSTAIPVSRWQNGLHPSLSSGTKLVHLDGDKLQGELLNKLDSARLWPRKIWPSYQKTALGADTNALELVSSEAKLKRVNGASLSVVACMRNEMFMLPHFLDHYRKIGVESFLISDNCSDDGTLEYLEAQPDVAVFSADTAYGQSHYGVSWQSALLNSLRPNRWSLVADADELLVYPGWESKSLPKYMASTAFRNADAVRIYMLDMYPEGPLSAATFESGNPFEEAGFVESEPFLRNSTGRGSYSNSRTVTSAVRHRLLPGSRPELFVAQKYALLKYAPWMRLSEGLHYVGDIEVAKPEMIFAHFKYNAHFRAKAVDEVRRGQHFNDAEEYRKYLALMSEGREVVHEPGISVPWTKADQVRAILGE